MDDALLKAMERKKNNKALGVFWSWNFSLYRSVVVFPFLKFVNRRIFSGSIVFLWKKKQTGDNELYGWIKLADHHVKHLTMKTCWYYTWHNIQSSDPLRIILSRTWLWDNAHHRNCTQDHHTLEKPAKLFFAFEPQIIWGNFGFPHLISSFSF